ncbi:hypothetical protein MKEN_00427900 [Mycena kentingensis (nom. inval.)]|nr:hypothetical protein MKEN_00427900 [Mycena kentingensis (nom. inval.)]
MRLHDSTSDNVRLPIELERLIFELAASQWPSQIPRLLLVAQRVRRWLEPRLYHTLITDASPKARALQTLIYTKPTGFFAQHTHQVYLTGAGHWSENHVRELLLLVPALDALAVSGIWGSPQQKLLRDVRGVRRWSGYLESVYAWGSEPAALALGTYAAFAGVTHMELFDDLSEELLLAPTLCAALASLPALTHLCLTDTTRAVLRDVGEACPRLEVLLFMSPVTAELEKMLRDPPFSTEEQMRARFVVTRLWGGFWVDWEVNPGTSGGFWRAADAFLERKRNREIADSMFWLEYKCPARLAG